MTPQLNLLGFFCKQKKTVKWLISILKKIMWDKRSQIKLYSFSVLSLGWHIIFLFHSFSPKEWDIYHSQITTILFTIWLYLSIITKHILRFSLKHLLSFILYCPKFQLNLKIAKMYKWQDIHILKFNWF
jgi:hypothetical protein